MHAVIILQSLNQLKAVYQDDAETIIDCCDSMVFLGGKSSSTTKAVSEMIGKTTLSVLGTSSSKGEHGSYSVSAQPTARDLLDPAEIARLDQTECLVIITGVKPFRSRKYDQTRHPNYGKLTGAKN